MMKTKKCVLILPYFGRFNNYFQIFLNSVRMNPKVDLLLITDNCQTYDYPDNVYKVQESFKQFVSRYTEKFDINICLETPYKLCDFKPTYGYLLSDFISEYEYWGFCDCDLIFGNLEKLLFPLLDKGYDKLFALGHLTLFKNTEENNKMFMEECDGRYFYREFLSTAEIKWFDEDYKQENIHTIFLKKGKKVFSEDYSINPEINSGKWNLKKYNSYTRSFCDIKYHGEQYFWENGNLIQVKKENGRLIEKECMYMHFQLRKMLCSRQCMSADIIKIVPNRFIAVHCVPRTEEEWKHERKIYFYPQRVDLLLRRIRKKLRLYK